MFGLCEFLDIKEDIQNKKIKILNLIFFQRLTSPQRGHPNAKSW